MFPFKDNTCAGIHWVNTLRQTRARAAAGDDGDEGDQMGLAWGVGHGAGIWPWVSVVNYRYYAKVHFSGLVTAVRSRNLPRVENPRRWSGLQT